MPVRAATNSAPRRIYSGLVFVASVRGWNSRGAVTTASRPGSWTSNRGVQKMQTIPGYKTTYELVKPGSGPTVTKGATVTVHATGVVKETGKKFWQVAPKVARELVRTARAPARGD